MTTPPKDRLPLRPCPPIPLKPVIPGLWSADMTEFNKWWKELGIFRKTGIWEKAQPIKGPLG